MDIYLTSLALGAVGLAARTTPNAIAQGEL